jgi:glutathione synthetase
MNLVTLLKSDSSRVAFLSNEAIAWLAAHGYNMVRDFKTMDLVHCPCTLVPSPFPRSAFEIAVGVQPLYQELYFKVAQDHAFLQATLASTAQQDEFVARLLRVHREVYLDNSDSKRQTITLNIARSDYMVQGSQPLQIEYNTISCALGVLATGVANMHAFFAQRGLVPELNLDRVLLNGGESGLVSAIADAHLLHGFPGAVVLMVVTENETNICDQRKIEYGLFARGIPMMRQSLRQLHVRIRNTIFLILIHMQALGSLDAKGQLFLEGKVVSVVYYRAGYIPAHFPSEVEWNALELVERSLGCASF